MRNTASIALWHKHRPWCWAVFVLLVLAEILFIFFVNLEFANEYNRSQEGQIMLTHAPLNTRITLDFGDKKRAFEGTVSRGMTIGSALYEITDMASLHFVVSQENIVSLDEYRGEKGHQWNIYLNGTKIEGKTLLYPVRGGDKILIRYE